MDAHTWVVGNRYVFALELQTDENGYCGATLRPLSGPAALKGAEKAEFLNGLLSAISRLAVPDRLCLPLLRHPRHAALDAMSRQAPMRALHAFRLDGRLITAGVCFGVDLDKAADLVRERKAVLVDDSDFVRIVSAGREHELRASMRTSNV